MVPLGQRSSRSHSHMSSLPGRPSSLIQTRSSSLSAEEVIQFTTEICVRTCMEDKELAFFYLCTVAMYSGLNVNGLQILGTFCNMPST